MNFPSSGHNRALALHQVAGSARPPPVQCRSTSLTRKEEKRVFFSRLHSLHFPTPRGGENYSSLSPPPPTSSLEFLHFKVWENVIGRTLAFFSFFFLFREFLVKVLLSLGGSDHVPSKSPTVSTSKREAFSNRDSLGLLSKRRRGGMLWNGSSSFIVTFPYHNLNHNLLLFSINAFTSKLSLSLPSLSRT